MHRSQDWPTERLASMKGDTTIAVVIPARNEEATVGAIVEAIHDRLRGIVDELVVMDSLSSDRTAEIARSMGAVVHSVAEVRPDLGVSAGKGEALWKSMFVTNSEIVAFVDADLTDWAVHFVTGTVGPLLVSPKAMLCRGHYQRLSGAAEEGIPDGGRVTELVAKPWLAINYPALSRIVQPLAGEWAIRRSAFENLSIPVGYGVEISTLIDVFETYGPEGIAQVDLGRRGHRRRAIYELAPMATQVLAASERRRQQGVLPPPDGSASDREQVELLRLVRGEEWEPSVVSVAERPPISFVRGIESFRL